MWALWSIGGAGFPALSGGAGNLAWKNRRFWRLGEAFASIYIVFMIGRKLEKGRIEYGKVRIKEEKPNKG